jgi:NAD-dependent deacetylase
METGPLPPEIAREIKAAVQTLKVSRRIIALTGAGISTPSGIPDFRSPGTGVWENVDPFEVASIYAFKRRPEAFYSWILPMARLINKAESNEAHFALARMEEDGRLKGVITQNIDMLHAKAGSKIVFELHGHMREMTCLRCYSEYSSEPYLEDFLASGALPYCVRCGGILKPNLILYGEQLPMDVFSQASQLVDSCDVMLVIGSSLTISPACDLPLQARRSGASIIIVNFEPTSVDYLADTVIHANVVDVIPRIVDSLLNQ